MTITVRGLGAVGNLLDGQMDAFAAKAKTIQDRGEKAAAELIVAAVAKNLGGKSITLHGVGKKGAKVSVRASFRGESALVDMSGPAQLIERDTKAHTIIGRGVGRTGKGSRSASAKHAAKQDLFNALFGGTGGGVLKIPGSDTGLRTGPVQHPGTQGKHPFAHGVDAVRPVIPRVFQVELAAAARAIFQ